MRTRSFQRRVQLPRSMTAARRGLTALIGAFVLLLCLQPAASSAAVANFSCTLLAPNTWCRHGTWHNYNSMGVSYPGTGSIQVCARMVRRSGGGVYASVCGTNAASSSFARCNCGGLWNDIRHSAPNNRNLKGWGGY